MVCAEGFSFWVTTCVDFLPDMGLFQSIGIKSREPAARVLYLGVWGLKVNTTQILMQVPAAFFLLNIFLPLELQCG